MLRKFLYYRPRLEAVLSAIDRQRLKLPIVNPRLLFDDFDRHPVTLTVLPAGAWSSPIADVVTLAKIALSLKSRRVLEVGSYRGYTTKLLAEHTLPDTRIVAVDREPQHGEAYRDTPIASKIERRVSEVSPAAFASDAPGSYDLIFLDADHSYRAVKHDTEVLLPLLSPTGVFVWHDYANWGKFSERNGVPEFLHELAQTRVLASVAGSWLAVHMPAWRSGSGAEAFAKARQAAMAERPGDDPWTTDGLRG